MEQYVCLTPYRELRHGSETLFTHVGAPCALPVRVKQYLLLGTLREFIPGIYRHPFTGKELIGPALFGDGVKYTWDRDTLEYAERYGLALPAEFVEYVMSGEGFANLCRMRRMA